LRADFNFKLSKLTTMPYDQFAETISNPSHLSLFRVEPLPGIGVLEVQPRLAMNMANRMLGGKGASVDAERYLTEIEIALLEEVVVTIMAEWCAQWRDDTELNAKMVGHESNAKFLQICTKQTVLLVAALELQSGDAPETMQIAVPFQTVEPMVKKLQQARAREAESGGGAAQSVLWRNTYDEISIPVVADWPVASLSLADVARLQTGDFLQLPLTVIDRTRVRLAETTQFVGRAGRENGRVAVQLNNRASA
jgi:flagellar motor switch protein FliM